MLDILTVLDATESGLSSDEAARRLSKFGPNVLSSRTVTVFGVLGRQLRNPLLILLLAAAVVSAATGDVTDGGIIAAIVVLSVGLGFVNEYRSEVAVAALHANIRHEALVWRDGTSAAHRRRRPRAGRCGDVAGWRPGPRRFAPDRNGAAGV